MDVRQQKRQVVTAVAWLAGLLLLALLVRRVGGQVVVQELRAVGPRILWLCAAYAAGTALTAAPWNLLLDRETRPGWGAAIVSRFSAAGLNALLPFVGVGEVSRLLWLRRAGWGEGVAAMVVDRLLFLVASALSLVVGAVATLFVPRIPRAVAWAAAGAGVVLLVLALAIGWVALRTSPVRVLGRWLEKLRAAAGKVGAGGTVIPAAVVDDALKRILGGPRRTLVAGVTLHLGGRLFYTGEIYAALRLLDADPDLAAVAVLAAVPVALSIVGAAVPSQIGLQEGAQGAMAAALGLGATAGLLIVLLQRIRQLLFVPVTAVLLALGPWRPRDTVSPGPAHHPSRLPPRS